MYKFDRELQKDILTKCIAIYPGYTSWKQFPPEIQDYGDDVLIANIRYLAEHKLITIRAQSSDDPYTYLDHMKATASGIDFMLNDGGLSAILKVQTIRIHRDTIVAIEDLIALSNLSAPEKASIVSKLRELPADAIKHLILQLLTQGAVHVPAALQLIQKALQ